MESRLTELKNMYKEMAKGLPNPYVEKIAKEVESRLAEREMDLMTPHSCDATYMCPNAGADLDALDAHTVEFRCMIEDMFEKLLDETKILEGVDVPEYNPKTDVHTTSGVESNGAITENLVAGQSSVHPHEQAGEALCDGGDGATTRTDVVGDVSSIQATGE